MSFSKLNSLRTIFTVLIGNSLQLVQISISTIYNLFQEQRHYLQQKTSFYIKRAGSLPLSCPLYHPITSVTPKLFFRRKDKLFLNPPPGKHFTSLVYISVFYKFLKLMLYLHRRIKGVKRSKIKKKTDSLRLFSIGARNQLMIYMWV